MCYFDTEKHYHNDHMHSVRTLSSTLNRQHSSTYTIIIIIIIFVYL